MKILFHSTDKPEIYSANLLLTAKGIPTFIGNESSGPALGVVFANKYTLWVCLESQYDDAMAILNDPSHEAKEPVDMIDFQEYVDGSVIDVDKFMLGKAMWGIALTIVGIVGLVIIYAVSSSR
jgi:hypothetical protein